MSTESVVAATSGETSADEASPGEASMDEASMGEAPAVDVTRLRGRQAGQLVPAQPAGQPGQRDPQPGDVDRRRFGRAGFIRGHLDDRFPAHLLSLRGVRRTLESSGKAGTNVAMAPSVSSGARWPRNPDHCG